VEAVELVPNTNTIQELVVKSSVKGLGTIKIASEYLARMEQNVFLNITTEELLKLNRVKK